MKRNILYIFDEEARAKNVLSVIPPLDEARILISPLSTDEEKVSQIELALRSSVKGEFTKVPFVTCFNRKAFEIKDNFIKFIADFSKRDRGGKNLKEYFKHPGGHFSIWWYSLISEKNTSKTDSFHKLVKLLAIKELCEKYKCQEVWLDTKDAKLANAIKCNANALGIYCRVLNRQRRTSEFIDIFKTMLLGVKYFLVWMMKACLAKCIMISLNKRARFLKKCAYLFVTYFPYFDEQKLKEEGIFVNKHYEPLQSALRQKAEGRLAWLAMFFSREDFSWRKSLEAGRQINKCGNTLMFCEEWIGFFDWLKIPLLYIFFSMKYFLCLSWLSKNFKYPEGNLNIWGLFAQDWHDSFCGYSLLEGLLYSRIFKNVFNHLPQGSKVVYFAEMHCWEKALNIAARNNGKVKTVGIQHTIVPLLLLMYFNDPSELEDGDYIQKMPKPDYLACVGEITTNIFREFGWKENCVFSWGALRFQHFKRHLENIVPWQERKNRVVIALSIMPEESNEVLLYVYQAFKNSRGFEVFIKPHPNLPIDKLKRVSGVELDNPIFTICDTPLRTLLYDAKAIIVAESSASLEAIACGCPVIIPRLISVVDMNPLSGLSDLPIYVESPRDMRETVSRILTEKEPPFSSDRGKDFILKYCNLLDSEDDFLLRLEEKVIG